MADPILFQIDAAPTIKALNEIGASIDSLKTKQQELVKENKQSTDEYKLLTAEIKAVEKEQRGLNNVLTQQAAGVRALKDTTKSLVDTKNFENNSIIENRKLYNALYNQLLQIKNPSKELIAQTKQLSTTLKEQEAALGNATRNVGNYGQGFDSLTGKLKDLIPGMKGLQSAQQGVNMVMSANPIGGLIQLFFALKDILGSNAKVADQLTFAFDAINKAFQFVIDTIVETVTNFDKLTEAIQNPIKFFKDFALGTVEAGKAGFEASKQIDALVEAEGELALAVAKNNKSIAEQKTILADKTKSDAQRIAAAKEIIRLEDLNAENSVKQAQKVLEAEQLKMKGKTKSADDSKKLAELEANVINAEIEATNGKRRAQVRLNDLLGKENTANVEKNLDNEKKVKEDFAKWEQEQIKKQQQALQALEQEFILTERQRIEKTFAEKLNQVKGNGERENNLRIAIRQAQDKALADYDAKQNKSKIDKEQEQINALMQLDKQRYDNAIAQAELEIKDQQELARRKLEIQLQYLNRQLEFAKQLALADGELTESELANIEKIKLAIQGVQEQIANPPQGKVTFGSALGLDAESVKEVETELNNIASITQSVSGLVNTIYEGRRTEIESTKNAEIAAIEQSTMSEEQKKAKIGEVEKRAAMQTYEIQKRQFEVNKAISIVQAIIAGAQAVIAQLANPTPYVGFILAGLAAGTTAAQIAVISAQKPPAPPKFAKGVIGLQGAGTETSDSIPAQLSRGESVMTAKATRAFAPQLAQMELAVGNRPNFQLGNRRFAGGFIPMGDGGFSSRYLGRGVEQTQMTEKAMTDAVAKMPAPILQYEEFSRFESSREKSIGISEL